MNAVFCLLVYRLVFNALLQENAKVLKKRNSQDPIKMQHCTEIVSIVLKICKMRLCIGIVFIVQICKSPDGDALKFFIDPKNW